jgi:hypothetical protein
MLGHNYDAVQEEMNEFVTHVKEMRRRSRGEKESKKVTHIKRHQTPATSTSTNP